jgi:hypothetical protein
VQEGKKQHPVASNTFALWHWQWKSFGDKIDHNEMK